VSLGILHTVTDNWTMQWNIPESTVYQNTQPVSAALRYTETNIKTYQQRRKLLNNMYLIYHYIATYLI